MPSDTNYLNFVLDQLAGLDEITYRPMMGEFLLYYRGKLFGGIYDNRLLLKPVSSAERMMSDAVFELPYEGASKMLLVDNPDNAEFLCRLVSAMYEELLACKRKKF